MTRLEELREIALRGAARVFLVDGRCDPIAILVWPDRMGAVKIVCASPETKDRSAEALRKLVQETGVAAVAIVLEVWLMNLRPGDGASLLRIDREGVAAQPSRSEQVHVLIESATQQEIWAAEITRDSAGNGNLGPFVRKNEKVVGRFSGFFPRDQQAVM